MIRIIVAAVLLLCFNEAALAQRTGVLDPDSRKAGVASEFGLQSVSREQRTSLAVLLFDPQLDRTTRATAWAVNIVASQAGKEARLQANLCDIGACNGRFTVGATMTAPIDTTTKDAQFADLSGLTGSSRAEVIVSYGLTNFDAAPTVSLTGTAARPKYTYRTSGSLAKAELQVTNWSGSGAVAVKRPSWLAQVSFTHEQSRKAQVTSNVCTPSDVGPSGTVVCYATPIGEPADVRKNIGAVEGAYVFEGVAAIRVKASYDFNSDVAGIDVPIYIVPDASGSLSGGVRLGYRTDQDEFTAQLFFSLFKL